MSEQKQLRIRPILAILCDDIREEKNGKEIVIGIYKGNITINSPSEEELKSGTVPVLNLSLWVPFEAKETGNAKIDFKIVNPEKEEILINANVNVPKILSPNELSAFKFVGLPIALKHEGNIEVCFRNNEEEDWEILRSIPVKINPPSK